MAYDKTEIVSSLIDELKLDRNNMFIVGDSLNEARAAKANGIKSVAVSWGLSDIDKIKIANPDFIVNSVVELQAVLE